MTENTDGVAAGAKRHERETLRSHPNHTEKQTSSKSQRDFLQKMERSDPDAKTGGLPRAGVCPGHTHERGGTTAEVGTNGDHGHAAGTGRRRPGLAQVQGPNTVIIVEVAVRAGNERKRVRKCAERVEAGLLIHLPSGAETQLWMHKRPWPEGWKEPRNYRSRRRRRCLRNNSSNSRR